MSTHPVQKRASASSLTAPAGVVASALNLPVEGLHGVQQQQQQPALMEIGTPGGAGSAVPAEDWRTALARVVPAVVVLRVTSPKSFDTEPANCSHATGVIVDKERGLILTNRHVIKPGPAVTEAVLLNREEIPVHPLYRDPVHDFGFLHFDPASVHFMEYEAIPLAPEAAAVGLEIRVVGNDSGDKLSILAGTIARLDRDAPHYKKDGYNDFNTFYMQAASGTKGGSSGSPVIDCHGRAVALNAGSKNSGSSAYYLPLDRVVRALKILQQGKEPGGTTWRPPTIPRGTLQMTLLHKGFDETRRLGLRVEVEQKVRQASPPGETGMLVVDSAVPGGPAFGHLEPGDILVRVNGKVVTQFLDLETVLDDSVGRPISLAVERGGKPVLVSLTVQDLHSVTPSSFVELSGGVIHALSYQQARNFRFECGLVYVAEPGYMLSRAGVPKFAILKTLAGQSTPRIEDFLSVYQSLPPGARVPIEFYTHLDRHRVKSALATIDRHEWYARPEIYVRDDSTGLWLVSPTLLPRCPPSLASHSSPPSTSDQTLDQSSDLTLEQSQDGTLGQTLAAQRPASGAPPLDTIAARQDESPSANGSVPADVDGTKRQDVGVAESRERTDEMEIHVLGMGLRDEGGGGAGGGDEKSLAGEKRRRDEMDRSAVSRIDVGEGVSKGTGVESGARQGGEQIGRDAEKESGQVGQVYPGENGGERDKGAREPDGRANGDAVSPVPAHLAEHLVEPALVMLDVHVPPSAMLDGVHAQHFSGTGLIVHHSAELGLVAVDRNTVAISVSDVMLSFAAYPIEIPGEVVFLHPLRNYALVAYDPRELGQAGAAAVRAATLLPGVRLRRGDPVFLVGLSRSLQVTTRRSVVTNPAAALEIGRADSPRFRALNEEVVEIDTDFGSSFSGALADEKGHIYALYSSFSTQVQYADSSSEDHQFMKGMGIGPMGRVVEGILHGRRGPPLLINGRLRCVPPVRLLEAEMHPILLYKARSFGLSDAWVQTLAKKDPKRRQVLRVKGTLAGSRANKVLEIGDMLLAIGGQPITSVQDVELACQQLDAELAEQGSDRWQSEGDGEGTGGTLPMTILRQGREMQVSVGTDVRNGLGTTRMINWAGGMIQAPHVAVRALGFLPPKGHGTYIARWCHGSPAHRYGLYALHWIVEINGRSTPDIDAFLDATKDLEHGAFVRVKTMHLNGKPKVLTLKLDLHYWPTWELRFDPAAAMWRRTVLQAHIR